MTISKMRVFDVRVTNGKHDAFFAIAPLNYCLRLVALNCIYRDGSKLKQSWSIYKNIFLILTFGILNAISLYSKFMTDDAEPVNYSFIFSSQFFFLFGYLQYIVDLIYVHKYGRDMSLEFYTVYNYIDIVLGIVSYGKCRRSIVYLVVFFTAITTTTSALDCTSWYVHSGTTATVTYGIDYVYVALRNLSMADAIAQVIQIEFRLQVLGNVLEDLYLTSDNMPTAINDVVGNRATLKKGRVYKVQIIDQQKFKITKLCGCYLLLLEQCDYINKMHGVRILGICFIILIDMIISLNYAIRILVGSLKIPYSGGFLVVSIFIWTCACAVVLFYKMYRCEQCYKQLARITRYIDCLLINKKITADTRTTLQNLRILVTSRPVFFHAVNFFKLDYALLLSIVSVVVTYTIILLQNLNN